MAAFLEPLAKERPCILCNRTARAGVSVVRRVGHGQGTVGHHSHAVCAECVALLAAAKLERAS